MIHQYFFVNTAKSILIVKKDSNKKDVTQHLNTEKHTEAIRRQQKTIV